MTFEEVRNKYPLCTNIKWTEEKWVEKYYYSNNDLIFYKNNCKEIQIIDDITVKCLVKSKAVPVSRVEGYLFNGETWLPVYETWDGWVELDIE